MISFRFRSAQVVHNFHPSLKIQVRQGVCTALQQILEKRVLVSLAPLFETPKFDRELRNLIRETFPEFCTSSVPIDPPVVSIPDNDRGDPLIDMVDLINDNNHNSDIDAKFSDDENDENKSPVKKNSTALKLPAVNDVQTHKTNDTNAVYDFNAHTEVFSNDLKKLLQDLHKET